ncbi:MAG: hypothetical protein K8S97_00900, partial [Anaerolineae bacterium]|nr:hypothetical protein [Anaerolineae bacterium]
CSVWACARRLRARARGRRHNRMWANVLDMALMVCGWAGILLLLHGLLLWEGISLRRAIVGAFRKRKRKKKAQPLSDSAMRIMLWGAVVTVLAAVARFVYELIWTQSTVTGFLPVLIGIFTFLLIESLNTLSASRESLRTYPQLWDGMRQAAQGTSGILCSVGVFIVLQNPTITGLGISIQLAGPVMILCNVLYHRRNRRWKNELIP